MDLPRADSTTRRGATPTFQRPISRPVSSRVFGGGGGALRPASAAVRHRPVQYDYATGSTFSVKINGKPTFLLGDFRKKVDKNVKGARFVTAFKQTLKEQTEEKKKQDMIRDQYPQSLVGRFRPVEHTEAGLTKYLLGVSDFHDTPDEPPTQGKIGYSRIDKIEAWEDAKGGGLEKYNPCITSVFAPAQFHGLVDTDPQWQREPASHLKLDFVYGYQGASCADWNLFGIGPGLNNLFFTQYFDSNIGRMKFSGEIVYFSAATAVVFDFQVSDMLALKLRCPELTSCMMEQNNVQRFFHHDDDITACALLTRVHQRLDAAWEEMTKPTTTEQRLQWTKFFAFSEGVYKPQEKAWNAPDMLLPQHSDEFPNLRDGQPNDWRNWDLPNRCIVATGQKGRNPRIFVWRIPQYQGRTTLETQVLTTMTVGAKRRQISQLSFNGKGNLLVALTEDTDRTIVVFDWRHATKIREAKGHGDKVECLRFNPYSDSAFASCGTKHLKFWELGDSELQEAVGLFGDLGETLDQTCMAFHPRGNTLSGTECGDVYIWGNGVVIGKIEKAHKSTVTGVLFVEGVGIFTSGLGGYIKVWDDQLRDLKKPIGMIDLRAFCKVGSPQVLQRLAGRSMDWVSDKEQLQRLFDDNWVYDEPDRGISGAPATGLSFRDLGCDGALLVGTTLNTVIAIGVRKVEAWASKGLHPEAQIFGDSSNSIAGQLAGQPFWNHVDKFKGRNGASNNHLPIAVYWYQIHDAMSPGYRQRHPTGRVGPCPWKIAFCGKKIFMNGHMSYVDAVTPMPNERIFVSVSKDCTARLWDINDQIMIDKLYTYEPCRSAAWWCRETTDGPDAEEVILGKRNPVLAVGHENGSFSVWRLDRSSEDAANQDDDKSTFVDPEDAFGEIILCSVNPLPRKAPPNIHGRQPSEQIFDLKYSPDGRLLCVCTGDNVIDVYKHAIINYMDRPARDQQREKAKQKALGLTDEEIYRQCCFPYKRVGCFNEHSSAVLAVDFDVDSSVIRSVSQSNEILFGLLPSGRLNTSTQECSMKKWHTQTCKLGWTVKSIWGKGSTSDDINSVDRSKKKVPPWAPCHGGESPCPWPWPAHYIPTGSDEPMDAMKSNDFPGEGTTSSWGCQVLATAEDTGKINLFRYPVFGFKQAFRSYIGHGSHVMDVKFSYDDDYLISAGGADTSVFQWRHVIPNKIYVQNLPDARKDDGSFEFGYWELRKILEDMFCSMVKLDSEKIAMAMGTKLDFNQGGGITESMRRDDAGPKHEKLRNAWKQAERKTATILQGAAAVRALKSVKAHTAVTHGGDEAPDVPDREIVAIHIFNSGAADEGKAYPSPEHGAPITSRWATIVLRTRQEADEIVDLYGGGSEVMISHPELFSANILHLMPLYECLGPSSDPDKRSGPWESPTEPPDIVTTTFQRGKKVMNEWRPIANDKYSPKFRSGGEGNGRAGLPHFLRVTPYDPNEQPLQLVVPDNLSRLRQEMAKKSKIAYESGSPIDPEDQALALFRQEQEENAAIKEWLWADEKYGNTNNEYFPSYFLWKKGLKQSKEGK